MDWGNAIVQSIARDSSGNVTEVTMDLHLSGDFKTTQKKITWLAKPSGEHQLVNVELHDYDYLVTKRKLEKDDTVADVATKDTEYTLGALADANVLSLKQRDIIQFERKGYFIVDAVRDEKGSKVLEFIRIPDGRAAGLALKSGAGAGGESKVEAKVVENATSMYKVSPINSGEPLETQTDMYKVKSVYE